MSVPPPGGHRRAELAQHGLLALPLAFAGLPVYLHAPDYYASHHGVGLGLLGAVLLGLRLVDAFQDPLIGALSDRLHRHRRSVLAAGMALMAAGFWMVFNPAEGMLLAWFAAGVLLCTTGYSVVGINLLALGGLWESTPSGRTRIAGWREAAGLAGLLLASVAPALLGSADDPGRAFRLLSLAYLPLLAVAAALFFRWMSRARIAAPAPGAGGLAGPLRRAFSSRWSARFFSVYLLNSVAGALPAVLVVFFVRDRLGVPGLTGLFLLLYFVSGALSMPAWRALSVRVGKARAWLCSMWLAVGTFLWAALLGEGDAAAFAAVCAMSGFALGADLSLPPSMLADRIARRREEGIASCYFSALTFLTKSALVLATGVALPALGALGYQPGAVVDDSVTVHLAVAYALVPCVLKAGTALLLLRLIGLEGGGEDGKPARGSAHAA